MQLISDVAIANSSVIALVVTTLIAAWSDWTRWTIPNSLIAGSAAAALMLAAFAPDRIGFGACLLGGLVGFALFMPLYVAKGMAAGDVKLMTVIGMYAGPLAVIDIALMSCLIGGAWALIVMARTKGQGPFAWLMLRSQAVLANHARRSDKAPPAGQKQPDMIPYGVVIALGTFTVLI